MAWGDFLRQFEAQGREKGDGYSPRDFDGMSQDERVRARAMMLERALTGDDIDLLSGLRYIGDAATAATLDAAAATTANFGWSFDITRLQVLFELTGQQRYLTDLARYLDGRDPKAQERAGYALTWYVLPPEAEPFLLDRIADGRHDPALLPLLKAWIALHQRAMCDTPCFQRNIALVRTVSNARPFSRRALLADAAATFHP